MKLDAIVTELPTCHKHNSNATQANSHTHTRWQKTNLVLAEVQNGLRKKQQVELNWRKRDIKRERERGRETVLLFVSFCEQLLLIYVDFLGRSWTSFGSGKHKLKDFFDNPWNYDTYYLSKRIRKTVLAGPEVCTGISIFEGASVRLPGKRRINCNRKAASRLAIPLCAVARAAPHLQLALVSFLFASLPFTTHICMSST